MFWTRSVHFTFKTRKSSWGNARGIPPARERKMLTPPAGWTWPPPASWTWPPPSWTWTPPLAGLTFDLTPPAGWTWPPPPHWIDLWPEPPLAGLTFWPDPPPPPPPGWIDLWPEPTPPQVWTDWKHYLPHPSDAGGKKIKNKRTSHPYSSLFLIDHCRLVDHARPVPAEGGGGGQIGWASCLPGWGEGAGGMGSLPTWRGEGQIGRCLANLQSPPVFQSNISDSCRNYLQQCNDHSSHTAQIWNT